MYGEIEYINNYHNKLSDFEVCVMKKVLIPFVLLIIVIGGCANMDKSKNIDDTEAKKQSDMNEYEKENYVLIQEYTGEGFELRDSKEETGKIARKYRDEVESTVEDFFLEKHKVEVKVHNIVSAEDGVSVFVESVGNPHFYTYAIVPVDIKNKEVKTDQVWSQEGQVEYAIGGGLYAMAFEKEFEKLDNYLKKLTDDYPIVGVSLDVVENVRGDGHATPYYFISPAGDVFEKLYDNYIQNPDINKSELKRFFKENKFEPNYLSVAIELYMDESDYEPDEEIYNQIVKDIKNMEDIPRGKYYISLNDSYIDKKRAIGKKDNTINQTKPDGIIKH